MSTRPRSTRLTVTSFAILAELALRPWSAYELAKQMRGNVRFMWSRAESRIYEETKRLVGLGLATAERSFTGRRGRTVYTITPAGRAAVARWLGRDGEPGFTLEYENLLRVFFGSLGNPTQLRRAVEAMGTDGAQMLEIGGGLAREYLERASPFQDEVHLRALTFDFLFGLAAHLDAWSQRTAAEIADWEDVGPEGKERRALQIIATVVERASDPPRRHPPPPPPD